MENFITPNDLKIDYATFRELAQKAIKESFSEWKKAAIEDRSPMLQAWVYISLSFITDKMIDKLKYELESIGWNNVSVERQNDRGQKIYIYLAF